MYKQLDFTTCCINKGKKRKVVISTDLLQNTCSTNQELIDTKRAKSPVTKPSNANEIIFKANVPPLITKRNPFYIGPLKNASINNDYITRYDVAESVSNHQGQVNDLQVPSGEYSRNINTTGKTGLQIMYSSV